MSFAMLTAGPSRQEQASERSNQAFEQLVRPFRRELKVHCYRMLGSSRYGEVGRLPKGTVLSVIFELEGERFEALNAGPHFKFTETKSLSVSCATQTEQEDFREKLPAGGEKGQCGWLKDKFGLSWQIVPSDLGEMIKIRMPRGRTGSWQR